jgi:hypothetical protein
MARVITELRSFTDSELDKVIGLCIGHIGNMAARPERPGDGEEYDKYRNLAMEAKEILNERKIP